MHSTIRVGIVGAQFAARFHLACYKQVFGVPVEVVGVVSRSRKSAEAFAGTHGLTAFESLESLLNTVDVVDICAPAYVHEAVAVEAFKSNKHVIVEKPLTGYFGSGQELFDARGFFQGNDDAGGLGQFPADTGRSRPIGAAAHVCRELGLRALRSKGAGDSALQPGSNPVDDGGGIPQRIPLRSLRALVPGREEAPLWARVAIP